METQKTTNISQKVRADKLCLAAILSLIIGISSFFLCLILNCVIQPHWHSSEDVFAIGMWLGLGMQQHTISLLPRFFLH